jgi:hypothetical protein
MSMEPTLDEELAAAQELWTIRAHVLAAKMATREGYDYIFLRKYSEEGIGPSQDTFDQPAQRLLSALDDCQLTLSEIAEVLQPYGM